MSLRRRIASDPVLTRRILLTWFLLGLVYVVFISLLIAIGAQAIVILVIAGVLLFIQFFYSDRIALYGMRAQLVSREQAPELYTIIERLCALADLPMPRVAISDIDVPNAFATGRSSRKAVVCVTSGILRRLEPAELEGVLAHELSHVAHRDVAVMTIASFLGLLAGLATRFALYSGMWGGGGDRDEEEGIFLVVIVSALVYAISFLLIRALSRYRELAADRSGAVLTARPSALASALVKVTGDMARIPTRDLRQAEPFNAFLFAPALVKGTSISALFSTHPTLERRLAQLSEIEAELGKMA